MEERNDTERKILDGVFSPLTNDIQKIVLVTAEEEKGITTLALFHSHIVHVTASRGAESAVQNQKRWAPHC